jgi:site-specific DNA-methyltransferase (cytosine-N4-specific)
MSATLISANPAYSTQLGAAYVGDSLKLLADLPDSFVNLVVTSPPFALQRQKEYGNHDQAEYVNWLMGFGQLVHRKLREDGSFVLDLGGAYQKGLPVRSLHQYRVLLRFCDEIGYHLAQEFFWHNPSKLPSPIEWVNKRKLRAKDTVNTLWWFSRSEWPKAYVSNVLTEYSPRMKKLLEDPAAFYTPKLRPSGHEIGLAFATDNGGAIPSNLLQIPNSESNGVYLGACKEIGVSGHPARFPSKLPEFFIRMLTDPGDLVVDIFAGSNTTGMVAEAEGRHWLAFELNREYVAASVLRFVPKGLPVARMRELYESVLHSQPVSIEEEVGFQSQLLAV